MAATYKLNIPIPASKDSRAFAQALKVCIASTAYGIAVDYAKAPGAQNVSLEIPKERKTLYEPNSIVRYFAAISKTGSPPGSFPDYALIEWEESVLESARWDQAQIEPTLQSLEVALSATPFIKVNLQLKGPESAGRCANNEQASPAIPSAAEIILFASVYAPISALPSASLAIHPLLRTWFFNSALVSPWALSGVQQAASQTEKMQISAGDQSISKSLERKVKLGVDQAITVRGKKILPQAGAKNILITSALPYVNNEPHLGNIIGSVLSADVFSRFCKARGLPTLFVCGTDEYGTTTETKALEEKISPKELCDKYHPIHARVYEWFEIGFDHFGRTTTQQQTDIAQDIFTNLREHGFLTEKTSVQPYCEKHGSFLADRYVEGECPHCHYGDARGDQCDSCGKVLDPLDLINARCKLDGEAPVPRETKHIYLLLDKLQPDIEKWASQASEEGAWSSNGRTITESWLKGGLKPRTITRDLKWGTPVPLSGYEDKVLYVWFDACIGYVSITANYTKAWKQWWQNPKDVKLYQFMGKDNVPFHTVVFPGSQLGDGNKWTMLNHLSTTEYLMYENGKFSKSRGVGVFGSNAQNTGVQSSVWRYYLLSNRPETADSQFEWKQFIQKNNSELLANLGNFVNRLIKFANAKFASKVPEYRGQFTDSAFDDFKSDINTRLKEYVTEVTAVHLRTGLEKVMAISSRGNQFLQDNKLDNALLASQPDKAAAVVGLGLNLIYLLSAIVGPYMPSTSDSILEQLNAPPRIIPDEWNGDDLLPGHNIRKAKYLFTTIDPKKEDEWRSLFGGSQAERMKKEDDAKKKAKKQTKKKQATADS
ncbi:MAG: hypothetical protein M1814_001673 [Vezdaea aestivalis]|nr:MAG: hypothetical protein M1814_001673 [Vezdaea aestivalis]